MIDQHNHGIDFPQAEPKERDRLIENVKIINASSENPIAAEKMKSHSLEEEQKSLDETLPKARGRLEKFHAFIFRSVKIGQQWMVVICSGYFNVAY